MCAVVGPEELPGTGRLQPQWLVEVPINGTADAQRADRPVLRVATVGTRQPAGRGEADRRRSFGTWPHDGAVRAARAAHQVSMFMFICQGAVHWYLPPVAGFGSSAASSNGSGDQTHLLSPGLSPGSRSAMATGSSQWGQHPPGPTRRQNRPQSVQRCSPRYRTPHAGHSYTVAGRGVRAGSGGTGGGWRCRQAAWRQAAEQKRCRPTERKACPQRGHGT